MNINIKDTLTLSDKREYIVVSKIRYEDKTYYYLVEKNELKDVLFCYEEADELVELNDKELTTKLLPVFLEAAKDEAGNIELN